MCLNSVELNLFWNKNAREYIGTGYKKIRVGHLSRYGRVGRWIEATGEHNNPDAKLNKITLAANDGKQYHPGFHVFLKKNDAKKYCNVLYNYEVWEVQFKGVISFGENETDDYNYGPCVISRYMKLVKKVS